MDEAEVVRTAGLGWECRDAAGSGGASASVGVDALCEDAGATPGVYGSRLTGAGFGGSALHLVERSAAVSASQEIAARFRARFGRSPTILAVRASEGATVEER